MDRLEKSQQTHLDDIQKRSGLAKHGEMVSHLEAELGLGHGDANTIVHPYEDAG